MKRNIVVLVWIGAIFASLLMVSCQSKVGREEASGTIGKVKKYRKDQMTEKDILLRSDIMQDTAKLDEIIQGLAVFSAYATSLSTSIENRLLDMESIRGFDEKYDSFVNELTDFRDFLKNNNEVLTTTMYMLGDFYKDTISESSADVENNLRLFANYVDQMEQKDSILRVMVNNLDTYISESETTVVNKEEIEKLKSIRDELLIRVIQQAYVFNDPATLKSVGGSALYNIDNLSAICDVDKLQLYVGSFDVVAAVGNNVSIDGLIVGDQGTLQYAGTPAGAESALPPSGPVDIAVWPSVVRGFVIADKDIVANIDQLRDNPTINSYVIGLTLLSSTSGTVSSQDQLQVVILNIETVGSAVLSAQDFVNSNASLNIIEPY